MTSAADLAGRLFQGTGGKLYSVPIQDGDEFVSGGIRYSVTSADGLQVSVIGHGSVGRSLTIPATVSQRGVVLDVVSVASKAFYVCEGLKTVTISGATTIGSKAFAYSPSLSTVRLSDDVTTIGDYAFYGCSKISDINVPQGASVKSHTFGSLKFYDGDTLLTYDQIPGGHYVGSGGKLYLTAA